jgi:hypothetical protein
MASLLTDEGLSHAEAVYYYLIDVVGADRYSQVAADSGTYATGRDASSIKTVLDRAREKVENPDAYTDPYDAHNRFLVNVTRRMRDEGATPRRAFYAAALDVNGIENQHLATDRGKPSPYVTGQKHGNIREAVRNVGGA